MKVPPQNLEAEKSVLGAVIIDSDIISSIADSLKPHHFYAPSNSLIYETMLDLFYSSRPIDVITLSNELKTKKRLTQVGGIGYLSELATFVPTSSNVQEYARIVKALGTRRLLIKAAGKVDELAYDEETALEEVMNTLEAEVFNLSINTGESQFTTSAKLVQMYFEKAEEYAKNPGMMRGIPSGLTSLDSILGGFHNSDLVIIAARPAVGKSSLALDFARHAAVDHNKSVAIFSLEMPEIQVIERLIAQQINANMWDLRMGRFTDETYSKFAEGADLLSKAKIGVDDTPGLTVNQLRSKARKLKIDMGLDMIIIDYLQLMQGTGRKNDSRATEVSEISRSLKILARELNIPILALSQLNRSVESRNDHRPQLSDLRESGSIEQDADLVMFINREKLYNPDTERPDAADIIVAKHRNGPVGMVEVKFLDHSTKFVDK